MSNEITDQLRKMASECEDKTMQLPFEMTGIINGDEIEQKWCTIRVDKVLSYMADMSED